MCSFRGLCARVSCPGLIFERSANSVTVTHLWTVTKTGKHKDERGNPQSAGRESLCRARRPATGGGSTCSSRCSCGGCSHLCSHGQRTRRPRVRMPPPARPAPPPPRAAPRAAFWPGRRFQNRARAVGGDLCACGSSSPRCWRVPSPALWQMPRPCPIPACKRRASRLSAHGSHLSLLRSVSFFLPP